MRYSNGVLVWRITTAVFLFNQFNQCTKVKGNSHKAYIASVGYSIVNVGRRNGSTSLLGCVPLILLATNLRMSGACMDVWLACSVNIGQPQEYRHRNLHGSIKWLETRIIKEYATA